MIIVLSNKYIISVFFWGVQYIKKHNFCFPFLEVDITWGFGQAWQALYR